MQGCGLLLLVRLHLGRHSVLVALAHLVPLSLSLSLSPDGLRARFADGVAGLYLAAHDARSPSHPPSRGTRARPEASSRRPRGLSRPVFSRRAPRSGGCGRGPVSANSQTSIGGRDLLLLFSCILRSCIFQFLLFCLLLLVYYCTIRSSVTSCSFCVPAPSVALHLTWRQESQSGGLYTSLFRLLSWPGTLPMLRQAGSPYGQFSDFKLERWSRVLGLCTCKGRFEVETSHGSGA